DGLPIRGWNPEDSLTRLSKMLALDLEMRRQLNMTEINSAEVLPGEEICNDSIVRRSTTAEAMGETAFQAAQLAQPGRKVTIEEARILMSAGANVMWRPNGENYALVLDGEETNDQQ